MTLVNVSSLTTDLGTHSVLPPLHLAPVRCRPSTSTRGTPSPCTEVSVSDDNGAEWSVWKLGHREDCVPLNRTPRDIVALTRKEESWGRVAPAEERGGRRWWGGCRRGTGKRGLRGLTRLQAPDGGRSLSLQTRPRVSPPWSMWGRVWAHVFTYAASSILCSQAEHEGKMSKHPKSLDT